MCLDQHMQNENFPNPYVIGWNVPYLIHKIGK